MDSDLNQQAPAQTAQKLDLTLRAQMEQLVNQSVKACLRGVLPQVVSQGLAGMNVPTQPPAQSQQPGLSAEAFAASVAAAIAAQRDKPREPKEPSPWEEVLGPYGDRRVQSGRVGTPLSYLGPHPTCSP